mmetsp:Transcript_18681/g.47112  ORF Transcript_18681/g.47112 Transcript_18681/m.47112 type:complete len:420 (+) Transcript_18681:109-1368(+)
MSSARIPDPEGNGEWVEATDPSTGRTYYVNHTTKATSWTAPVRASQAAPQPASRRTGSGGALQRTNSVPPAGGHEGRLPPNWEMRQDGEGRTYYMNHANKTTHWTLPPEVRAEMAASDADGRAAGGGSGRVSFDEAFSNMSVSSAPSAPPINGGLMPPRRSYSLYKPKDMPVAQQRALEYAECVVCFDDMCKEQAGVFCGANGKRTCPHFLHHRCALEVANSNMGGKHCPVCRATFEGVMKVPGIDDDPHEWFKIVDLNGDGRLSQREVVEVLKAQLPIDYRRLEAELPELWKTWDVNQDNIITHQELLQPNRGLLAYVKKNFPRQTEADIPDIRTDKHGWFNYFDYDKSGTLEQGEVVRALIKTFRLSEDHSRINSMREIVNAVWGVFDFDNSGSIEVDEFAQPGDGLADSIIASMGG